MRRAKGALRTMVRKPERIVLHLEGEESEQGLALDNLEEFLGSLRQALRDFDRVRRLEHPRKPGHPEKRAEMVTAFRLLEFKPVGSNQLVVEPIAAEGAEAETLDLETPSLAVDNFVGMLTALDSSEPIDSVVTEALERALLALGPSGRVRVELPRSVHVKRRFTIDRALIARAAVPRASEEQAPVTATGRLYAINLERRTVGIRAASGIEWTCRYPAELDVLVKRLLDSRVSVRGYGTVRGRRGNVEVTELEPLYEWEQSSLFTDESVALSELLARQGVTGPQGLESLGEPALADDEEYDKFLGAILGTSD
jgi:hypothetical protein